MKKFELYDELERLSNGNEALEVSNPAYIICRRLFSELQIGGKFDPTRPGRMLDTLYSFESTTGNNDKVTQALVAIEKELNPVDEVDAGKMGSKSMNSQDLKALLEDFDKHRELEEVEAITREVEKDPRLKDYGHAIVTQLIQAKKDLEAKALAKGVNPIDADSQSDQVIITKNKIEKLTDEENISDDRLWRTAEKVVELAVETRTAEEALRMAAREVELDISTEWKTR